MLIALNENDPRPVYVQIVAQVKEQVSRGILHSGEELPGVRELADSLGINFHTVHQAYQRLRDEGIILLRLGRRARIAPLRQTPPTKRDLQTLIGPLNELITEAFHLNLSADEFRQLVDRTLQQRPTEGDKR